MESYSFKNVDFTYPEGEKKALCNISFTVQQGEFVILCGPSGCGKSTLLRHLKSCLTPHGLFSGEIRYGGTLLSELSQREQAQRITNSPCRTVKEILWSAFFSPSGYVKSTFLNE